MEIGVEPLALSLPPSLSLSAAVVGFALVEKRETGTRKEKKPNVWWGGRPEQSRAGSLAAS